jgi:Tol biopolymer transport system component/DNA-binding winged helix-turn-helix (wHTH) protein
MEELTARKVLRFGLFEVDFAAQELRKSGIKIKIQDQPFQILALLLERPGQIITREEIQRRLWAGDTFVDFDLGLNSAVKKLRQALGDESDNPRFVETLYRRGYRFLAPVQNQIVAAPSLTGLPALVTGKGPNGDVTAGEAAAEQPASKFAARTSAKKLFAYLLLPLLLGAGLAAGYWLHPPSPPRITGYEQLTHDGRQKFGLLSDGERLYLEESEGGRFVIAQVSASGGETSLLQTPLSNLVLGELAPDGSALLVGVFSETTKLAPIWSLPLPTGAPRRVGDLKAGSLTPTLDGKHFVYSRGEEVYESATDGTQAHKLFSVGGDASSLQLSPDGSKLSFARFDTRTGTSGVWLVGRDGSNPHPLFSGDVDSEHDASARWTPDGKYLLFSRFSQGHNNVWFLPVTHSWLERQPKAMQLTNGPLDFTDPLPSRDGKRIFVLGAQPRTELVRYDPAAGFRPFLGGMSVSDLAFSADGQWVTYVTVPDKALWRIRIDGSERMQLTDPGKLRAALPRWSPDGKQIVFMGRAVNSNWRVYLISSSGGAFQELVPGATIGFDPTWMPDGKSIVLSLNDIGPTGQGIAVVDLETRKVRDLPGSEHLFSPRVSPDGKYIAAITTDSQALMLFDVAAQRWTELARISVGYPSWSHDSRYVYFDCIFTGDRAFYRVGISDHKLERLASLTGIHLYWGSLGEWSGLGPNDSLLVARDASNEEVYAIDWQPN